MTAEAAALRFRRREEAQLIDTGTLTRGNGEPDFDEATGEWTDSTTTVYTGPAKIRLQGVNVGYDREAGGGDIRVNTLVLTLPGDTDVRVDDRWTTTASPLDTGLVGRTYRITDVLRSTWQITRKAMLEEVT